MRASSPATNARSTPRRVDLPPVARVGRQVGMRVGVVPDLMAVGRDAPGDLRIAPDELSGHEDGRTDVPLRERVEDLARRRGRRSRRRRRPGLRAGRTVRESCPARRGFGTMRPAAPGPEAPSGEWSRVPELERASWAQARGRMRPKRAESVGREAPRNGSVRWDGLDVGQRGRRRRGRGQRGAQCGFRRERHRPDAIRTLLAHVVEPEPSVRRPARSSGNGPRRRETRRTPPRPFPRERRLLPALRERTRASRMARDAGAGRRGRALRGRRAGGPCGGRE